MDSSNKPKHGDKTGKTAFLLLWLLALSPAAAQKPLPAGVKTRIPLPTSKQLLLPIPGGPRRVNSLPVTIARSDDGRWLALLNNGWGTEESQFRQSITLLEIASNRLVDFADPHFGQKALQTYFLGLAFSHDRRHLYASVASLSDLTGEREGNLGNGIAVYKLEGETLAPERFLPIPPQPIAEGRRALRTANALPPDKAVPYPAGLAVIAGKEPERLLVANNLADNVLLLDAQSGKTLQRFDLSAHRDVPAAYPYAVIATGDGRRAYCSLWNASQVAALDLESGRVTRRIPLRPPASPIAPGSHPTAMLLSPDEKLLYVALSNRDQLAAIDTGSGKVVAYLSTRLPGQVYGGSVPVALAQTQDGRRLFVANAAANTVAVFDSALWRDLSGSTAPTLAPSGFFPTEWYPTALGVEGDELFVATGKGQGTGANVPPPKDPASPAARGDHTYIAALLHGSLARLPIAEIIRRLPQLTREAEESNRMRHPPQRIRFRAGSHPIRHVIYIVKENRTYDQVFGDLKPGNGEPSLCLYGEAITPNEHKLARQFGILDNFYDSGEVSGDGHVWSDAAISSDYNELTWQINYRGKERLYDFAGWVSKAFPLDQEIADIDEPGTGFLWANVARHRLSLRAYGEFIETRWCNTDGQTASPRDAGQAEPVLCDRAKVKKGEPLPAHVGRPHGAASPWPWGVPLTSGAVATKPELRASFDADYPNFNLLYPDQLRADEFLNEFEDFVRARHQRKGRELPAFIVMALPDDHTQGTRAAGPRPAASVADNDLALGRIVEAVSHSPYWDDTAIFVLEDDAQNGGDHVDAHRSIAFVISKYSPSSLQHPFVDRNFYTTVSMVRTIEVLLGLPPMNNNDAQAPVIAPLFAGAGEQPPFVADWRNLENGLIYETNPPGAPGQEASALMDFSRPDAADSTTLNAILWRDRKGNMPVPQPIHSRAAHGHSAVAAR